MNEEKHAKHIRIIYTRALERMLSKCVSYLLKEEHNDKEKFLAFIENIRSPVDKAQTIALDNSYYKMLESLIKEILSLKDKTFDFDEMKRYILRSANALQKIQRERNSKKEKHKKRKFEDGY